MKKAVFISFNQAYYEFIQEIMDKQMIRGFTYWDEVRGRGSHKGDPHMGTHAWPTLNGAILAIVSEEKVEKFLEALKELDSRTEDQGLRAFVWDAKEGV